MLTRLQEDNKPHKNLYTSDGLYPTFKDLDQIFDNSDDASGDETVRLVSVNLCYFLIFTVPAFMIRVYETRRDYIHYLHHKITWGSVLERVVGAKS